MNEVEELSGTTVDPDTSHPVQYVTTFNGDNEDLYLFRVDVRPSTVPGGGLGAFLTFLGTRTLTPAHAAATDAVAGALQGTDQGAADGAVAGIVPRRNDRGAVDGHRRARQPRRRSVAAAPAASGGRLSALADDDEDDPPRRGVGFLRSNDPARDYVVPPADEDVFFSSHNDGCGLVDLGLYGPHGPRDRKTEEDFLLKDFLFRHAPSARTFDVGDDASSRRRRPTVADVVDVTDDGDGGPHAAARASTTTYVNEVGHDRDRRRNVLARRRGRQARYYLFADAPLRRGATVELLTDYSEGYERERERAGYGRANLDGRVGGDDDEACRRARDAAGRRDAEDLVAGRTPGELARTLCFLDDRVRGPLYESLEGDGRAPARSWVARRRLEWLGRAARRRAADMLSRPSETHDPFVCGNVLEFLARRKLDVFSPPPPFADAVVVPDAEDHHGVGPGATLWEVLREEICEEVLHRARRHGLPRPFDEALWCELSRDLLRNALRRAADHDRALDDPSSSATDSSLAGLLRSLAALARDAAVELRAESSDEKSRLSRLRRLSFTSSYLSRDEAAATLRRRDRAGRDLAALARPNVFATPAHLSAAAAARRDGRRRGRTLGETCRSLERRRFVRTVAAEDGEGSSVGYADVAEAEEEGLPVAPDVDWYASRQIVAALRAVARAAADRVREDRDGNGRRGVRRATDDDDDDEADALGLLCDAAGTDRAAAEEASRELRVRADRDAARAAADDDAAAADATDDDATDDDDDDDRRATPANDHDDDDDDGERRLPSPPRNGHGHHRRDVATTTTRPSPSPPPPDRRRPFTTEAAVFYDVLWSFLVTRRGWSLRADHRSPGEFFFVPPPPPDDGVPSPPPPPPLLESYRDVTAWLTFDADRETRRACRSRVRLFHDCATRLREERRRRRRARRSRSGRRTTDEPPPPPPVTVEWLVNEVRGERRRRESERERAEER